MTIHPKTQAKATSLGVNLIEANSGTCAAIKGDYGLLGPNAKDALKMLITATAFMSDWKVVIKQEEDGTIYAAVNDESISDGFECDLNGIQSLIAWLTDSENGVELEAVEETRPSSVVAKHYQDLYKENPRGVDNGDKLADLLYEKTHVVNESGKGDRFDRAAMKELLELNVEPEKLDKPWFGATNLGSDGRFRMTGRNLLVTAISVNGEMLLPSGEKISAADLGVTLDTVKKERRAKIKADRAAEAKAAKTEAKAAKAEAS